MNNIVFWASQAALENGLSQRINRRGKIAQTSKNPSEKEPKIQWHISKKNKTKRKKHENTHGFECKRTWILLGDVWGVPNVETSLLCLYMTSDE